MYGSHLTQHRQSTNLARVHRDRLTFHTWREYQISTQAGNWSIAERTNGVGSRRSVPHNCV